MRIAYGVHRYAQVHATRSMAVLPAHNREPAQVPCFEIYWNNPQTTKPEDLLTEVYVPLKAMWMTDL